MKKITLFLFLIFALNNIQALENGITLRFTANHNDYYSELDSIIVENITQEVSSVLYYPDTVLPLIPTNIDIIEANNNRLYVSQNYPNPFREKTNIDIYAPGRDLFNIAIYDMTGRKLLSHEITLEQGIHHFTFFACNKPNYILNVTSDNYSQKKLMIQIGEGKRSSSEIAYRGSSAQNNTHQAMPRADFPYEPGDKFKFTGFITDKHDNSFYNIKTDVPKSDNIYVFDIKSYTLTIKAEPEEGGNVFGSGTYQEGDKTDIYAEAKGNYEFINWAGDTEHVDDPDSKNTFVTMPANDISITANFEDYDYPDDGEPGDGVTDIDGNEYATVWINRTEWMAENLHVTRYKDGTDILGGLSADEWKNTKDGAYAIYPHSHMECIDSEEGVVEAYGKLYNWHAVDNKKGLCPEGWRLPSDDEWSQLVEYLKKSYDLHNELDNPDIEGVGNALKSCLQVNSPVGGQCATNKHPRWNEHDTHYGTDDFNFSALPGAGRSMAGNYGGIGSFGTYWSATETCPLYAWHIIIDFEHGAVGRFGNLKEFGWSVRCIKD